MRNAMERAIVALLCILLTPVWMVMGVIAEWKVAFCGVDTVKEFLHFGRLGAQDDVVVCTNINNPIWAGNVWEAPRAINKMRVHSFFTNEGKLYVKIYINEKLMEKFKNETASVGCA